MLLSIITRVYKRPKMLAELERSLEAQTMKGFEHIQLIDWVGVGIPKANARLRNVSVSGDYVLVLDDDDKLCDPTFVERLSKIKADVVVLKWQRDKDRILPDLLPLQLNHCGTSNVVVSKALWEKHSKAWGEKWAGDWDYIESVLSSFPKIVHMEGVVIQSQRISMGRPE